jgi:Uma2 family endonuclease
VVKPITKLLTLEEYLETEPTRELRHELVNGQIYAMAGAT